MFFVAQPGVKSCGLDLSQIENIHPAVHACHLPVAARTRLLARAGLSRGRQAPPSVPALPGSLGGAGSEKRGEGEPVTVVPPPSAPAPSLAAWAPKPGVQSQALAGNFPT